MTTLTMCERYELVFTVLQRFLLLFFFMPPALKAIRVCANLRESVEGEKGEKKEEGNSEASLKSFAWKKKVFLFGREKFFAVVGIV